MSPDLYISFCSPEELECRSTFLFQDLVFKWGCVPVCYTISGPYHRKSFKILFDFHKERVWIEPFSPTPTVFTVIPVTLRPDSENLLPVGREEWGTPGKVKVWYGLSKSSGTGSPSSLDPLYRYRRPVKTVQGTPDDGLHHTPAWLMSISPP